MSGRDIPCRLLLDLVPRAGAWNMAVDALLLEQAVDSGLCALRWYRWDQATLSLGHFQDLGQVPPAQELAGLPIVRRLSGGGAIVHDQELTYSLAIPAAHPMAAAPRDLYILVHQAVIEVLRRWDVPVHLRGELDSSRGKEFLCFGRGDSFDVVIGTDKVLGSAQRRRKGAVLQHGSLVLRRSASAPWFPGVSDLAELPIEPVALVLLLASAVGSVLSSACHQGELTSDEQSRVEQLVAESAFP